MIRPILHNPQEEETQGKQM